MKRFILRIAAALILLSIAVLLTASIAYLIAHYPRPADSFQLVSENPQQTILIATQGSQFKSAFINSLLDTLRNSAMNVTGIDLRNIEEMETRDWDKILIINTFMAKLNRDAAAFIDKAQDSDRILLLVTSGGADWQPNADLQVDAITSASQKSDIPELVDLVHSWILSDSAGAWQAEDYALSLKYFPRVNVAAACAAILSEQNRYKSKYGDLRRMLNLTGYMFLRLDDLESARHVFKLNLELFPDVWNVYDSYAEALLRTGDMEGAKIHYQKALRLNPDSKSAQAALRKL
ncbi:MAG: tetratricopeptide repeat protein [Candidatus Marinimicrobia bacterium]|nr:tetratricopeptide repeat protein [Candidatus Neomarinimicrobiota bacterium]